MRCVLQQAKQAHGNCVLAARPDLALFILVLWFCFADDMSTAATPFVRYSSNSTWNWKDLTACSQQALQLWIEEETSL